ncbi:MAG: hypothetical protein GY759_17885 [Chloroflexi bacterium]|nr:hypothetical protein [Chloroflexota bacterium]
MNNILKHAQAKQVRLDLDFSSDSVILDIVDDGVGFDVAAARLGGGMGLLGIEERVKQLGGETELMSGAGRGTNLHVEIPL